MAARGDQCILNGRFRQNSGRSYLIECTYQPIEAITYQMYIDNILIMLYLYKNLLLYISLHKDWQGLMVDIEHDLISFEALQYTLNFNAPRLELVPGQFE